jgi:hypothetical protein
MIRHWPFTKFYSWRTSMLFPDARTLSQPYLIHLTAPRNGDRPCIAKQQLGVALNSENWFLNRCSASPAAFRSLEGELGCETAHPLSMEAIHQSTRTITGKPISGQERRSVFLTDDNK